MRAKTIVFSLMIYSLFSTSVFAQSIDLDRRYPSNSNEDTLTPFFLREMDELVIDVIDRFQLMKDDPLIIESSKERFKIDKNKFLKLHYKAQRYRLSRNLKLNFIAYYGFTAGDKETQKVNQYCVIEPVDSIIEPKILQIKQLEKLNSKGINSDTDNSVYLTFYFKKGEHGLNEYYALYNYENTYYLILDAYMSEQAFEHLKKDIVKATRKLSQQVLFIDRGI